MATASFERFGRYVLGDVLGEGGMGIVYRAFDPDLGRDVAIKIMQGWHLDDANLERFRREARALGALAHPHIVTIFDAGLSGSEPYIVMEFVDGCSLSTAIAAGERRPFEAKVRAMVQVCDALTCAHQAGIIHRDVKPGNILLSERGGAKLADFGIARIAGAALTAKSQAVGSPAYIAPEIFNGAAADERSDVYGAAACLYEWLCGVRPHDADTLPALIARVTGTDPEPLSDLWTACPPSLERCVHRGLSRDPSRRYQSAAEFAADLRAFLGGATAPLGQPSMEAPRRTRFGRWIAAAAAVGTFGIFIVGNALRDNRDATPGDTNLPASSAPGLPGTVPAVTTASGDGTRKPVARPQGRSSAPPTGEPAGDEEDSQQIVAMPIGTVVKARVTSELRGDRNLAGHEFDATLSEPLVWNGSTVAAAGTPLKGLVNEVGGSESSPFLRLSLTSIRVGGVPIAIRTGRYQVAALPGLKLNVALTFKLAAPLPLPLKSS